MTAYHNPRSRTAIAPEDKGCPFAEWATNDYGHEFTTHPDGFRVFLPAGELASSDEYASSDPYAVAENISNPFHQRRLRITLDLLQCAIAPDQQRPRILDLGCGEGHLTAAMLRQHPGADITGMDYSLSAITFAHRHFQGIEWCVANAYHLPFAAHTFDVVVCNNIWEHVPDPLRLLQGIRTVLVPTGRIIISTPSRYRFENLLRVFKGRQVAFMSHHHVTEYTVGQVIEQLRFGGFTVTDVRTAPLPPGHWKQRLIYDCVNYWLRRVKSHHQLESTVFYLAQGSDERPT